VCPADTRDDDRRQHANRDANGLDDQHAHAPFARRSSRSARSQSSTSCPASPPRVK
jgi:hypothetical protein